MLAKLIEPNRKYVTEDGQKMIIKETGEINGKMVKNCWVLRDYRGFHQDQDYNLETLTARNNIELEK